MAEGRPDQGYAWAVAGACFCMNFLLVGLSRSVSMLYVALVEEYGVTRQQASLPFSIRVSLKNLAGPLIGLLGQRYGIRKVSSAGGFVAAVGCFLCYFAPSVMWITVFWGIVHGVGFGMANVIHMLTISQYFDKYRATALGLAYSGDCFGTFAFPGIIESLLESYNVRGTFLILSGILLNVVPMAMLLKKPPWLRNPETKVPKNAPVQNNVSEIPRESVGYRNESFLKFDEDLSPFQTQEDEYCTYNAAYGHVTISDAHQNSLNRLSVWSRSASSMSGSIGTHRKTSGASGKRNDSIIPVYEEDLAIVPLETSEVFTNDQFKEDPEDDKNQTDYSKNHIEDGKNQTKDQQEDNLKKRRRSSSISQIASEILYRVKSASFASQVAQDGFIANLGQTTSDKYLGPNQNSSEGTKNVTSSDNQIFTINTGQELTSVGQSSRDDSKIGPLSDNVFFSRNGSPQLRTSINQSSSDDSKNEPSSGNVIFSRNVKNELTLSLQEIKPSDSQQGPTPVKTKQPSILKLLIQTNTKPIFFLISMSMAVYSYCFIGLSIVLIDYAGDQGIPHHQAKFLVIGFSVTDLIGRLIFGQMIDRKVVKIRNFVSVILLVLGALVASLPFNGSFNYLMVCMCLIGAAIGGAAIMYPILVNHYMKKSEESVAMGCLNFYGGILALSMAPMIGHFRDNVGLYNGVFHIFGGLVALVGIAWQFEPLILKWQKRPQKNQNWVMVTRL